MSDEVNKAMVAYIEKFDRGPCDFEYFLNDPNDSEEWLEALRKAIDTNTPLEGCEGIFNLSDPDDPFYPKD